MIIAFLVFIMLGVVVAGTPGALLGYVLVVVSRGLSRGARVGLLLVLAAASSALWLVWVGLADPLGPAVMVLSFTATIVSGATFLGREARRRHALQFPPPVASAS